jgi:hypothetical protein
VTVPEAPGVSTVGGHKGETEAGPGAARPERKRPGGHKATRGMRACRKARKFRPCGTHGPIAARVAGLPYGPRRARFMKYPVFQRQFVRGILSGSVKG